MAALSALGGNIKTAGDPTVPSPTAADDAHAERTDLSPSEPPQPERHRPAEDAEVKAAEAQDSEVEAAEAQDSEVERTSSHAVLLAAVGAACITVAAVLVLNIWADATAPGSTNLFSADMSTRNVAPSLIDPVFEVRDKLVWLAALVGAGSLGLLLAWTRSPRRLLESWPVLTLTVAGAAGVAFSAAWIDPAIGLGPINLVLAVVLVPLLVYAVGLRSQGALRFLWPTVAAVGAALYAPALWQTPRGMYDPFHNARSIDELLGPVAGNLPLSDYVPQYGGLLGLPLVPFRALVAAGVESWIMAYLSVLSLVTVGALCAAAALMLPTGRRALGPLLVVPVLLMKPSVPDKLLPAGLQRMFSTIPERSLLPVVLAVVLLLAASRPGSRSRWLWVGAVASAAALNNFESGVPATVAAVLTLVALRAGWRAVGYAAVGWIGVAVAYVVLLLLAGGTFRPEYWVGFSLEFASGGFALPMPPYGTFVLVLFVLAASVASAFPVLWRRSASMSVAAVGGFYFGSWGLMMFPYYVGRSSSLGQLQFFFIPASVAAVWLLIGGVRVMQDRPPAPRLAYAALLCCLPAALFASTVIKVPSPEMSVKRITGRFGASAEFRSTAVPRRPVVDEERARVIREVSAAAPKPVGLFFTSGNVASLRTGLPNASVLAVPQELMPHRAWSADPDDTGNAAFRRMQCRSLEASDLNSVIAEDLIAGALDNCTGFSRGPTDRGMVVFTRDAG